MSMDVVFAQYFFIQYHRDFTSIFTRSMIIAIGKVGGPLIETNGQTGSVTNPSDYEESHWSGKYPSLSLINVNTANTFSNSDNGNKTNVINPNPEPL